MNRKLLWLLTVFLLASVPLAQAQQAGRQIPRIGMLFIGDRNQPHLQAFKQGLRERGYVEGQNIGIEYRYAGAK